jgi:FMN phosphatase YigB (HAD superfamily)
MTYVFDIDGTICNNTSGNYEQAVPFRERITKINNLYDQGHYIIMFTARGMGSSKNNQLYAINKYYSFTQNQLKSWDLKYHELILGKPSADFYVDDKGVKDEQFFSNTRNTL